MLNLKNTLDGYLKNVEVIGNTVQDTNNLADIRSVGDKVEGQELYKIDVVSCGKNLFNGNIIKGFIGNTAILDSNATDKDFRGDKYILCKPNTNYKGAYYIEDKRVTSVSLHFFDKDYKKINHKLGYEDNLSPENAKYIMPSLYSNTLVKGVVITENENAPNQYEPYQGDKLEILSPVQLEKVGDVADRIICKNGVWGVEKNVFNVDETLNWVESGWAPQSNTIAFKVQGIKNNNVGICNMFPLNINNPTSDIEAFSVSTTWNEIAIRVNKERLSSLNVAGFKNWLSTSGIKLLHSNGNLELFIPLPHDQQVKLRTFAGQTNIAFLTEIPGQIKAQVPKSLGATVNTHTEQIKDLHNSLDRVKKLEETTVSTIETGSSFTTVDATNNGYFEDVKLEGKTLVNLATVKSASFEFKSSSPSNGQDIPLIKNINGIFTLIVDMKTNTLDRGVKISLKTTNSSYIYPSSISQGSLGKVILCYNTLKDGVMHDITHVRLYTDNSTSGSVDIDNITIIEGDHTNNPPEYFEGLMSVGQDVEETSVLSVNNGNLAYNAIIEIGDITTKGENGTGTARERIKGYIEVLPSSNIYTSPYPVNVYEYDKDCNFIGYTINVDNFKTNSNTKYIRCYQGVGYLSEIILAYSSNFKNQINKQDKKEILYFNPTTETWEKPILREWDSIEKHADGKYYFHKRSEEIILNGSEGWGSYTDLGNVSRCYFTSVDKCFGGNLGFNAISDKFNQTSDVNIDRECMWINPTYNRFGLHIENLKLSTPDVEGFKAWLQVNPVKVVYQLDQEKIYECTNIDLMTYSGETNYIVNSGAISPKSLLKVHNNISNVVKILQEKVNLLENTFIAGLKSVLSGDMYSLATILYPEDFEQNDNIEQDIMVIPE